MHEILLEEGYQVWRAPDSIRGGRPWAEQIVEAIAACDVFLVLVSANSNGSSHVGREVNQAFDQSRPVVPVRVEDVEVSGNLRYWLAQVQQMDAFPPPLEQHRRRLASHLADILQDLGTEIPPRPPSPSSEHPPDRKISWQIVVPIAAILAIMLVGAVAVVGWPPWNPDDEGEAADEGATSEGSSTTASAGSPTSTISVNDAEFPSQVTSTEALAAALTEYGSAKGLPAGEPHTFRVVTSETGSFEAEVIDQWTDVDADAAWKEGVHGDGRDPVKGDTLIVAPNISEFYNQDASGIFVGFGTSDASFDTLTEARRRQRSLSNRGCTNALTEVETTAHTGHVNVWTGCDEEGAPAVVVAGFEGSDHTDVDRPRGGHGGRPRVSPPPARDTRGRIIADPT